VEINLLDTHQSNQPVPAPEQAQAVTRRKLSPRLLRSLSQVLVGARIEIDNDATPSDDPYCALIGRAVRLVYRLDAPPRKRRLELDYFVAGRYRMTTSPPENLFYIWLVRELLRFARTCASTSVREVAVVAVGLLVLSMKSRRHLILVDRARLQLTAKIRGLSEPVRELLLLAEVGLSDRRLSVRREIERQALVILTRARREAQLTDNDVFGVHIGTPLDNSSTWLLDVDSRGYITLLGPDLHEPTRLQLARMKGAKPFASASSQRGWILFTSSRRRPSGVFTPSSWSRTSTAISHTSGGALALTHVKDIGSFNASVRLSRYFSHLARVWHEAQSHRDGSSAPRRRRRALIR
jgi:hypothetical protein